MTNILFGKTVIRQRGCWIIFAHCITKRNEKKTFLWKGAVFWLVGTHGTDVTRLVRAAAIVMYSEWTADMDGCQIPYVKTGNLICQFKKIEMGLIKFHLEKLYIPALLLIFFWRMRTLGERMPGR